jgi:hypothetical protein
MISADLLGCDQFAAQFARDRDGDFDRLGLHSHFDARETLGDFLNTRGAALDR